MTEAAELIARLRNVLDYKWSGTGLVSSECRLLLDHIETLEARVATLSATAQSRYELLRECQAELRTLQAIPDGGLVEAIERALAAREASR